NLAIRPVNAKYFMSDEELAHEKALAHERAAASEVKGSGSGSGSATPTAVVAFAWAAVGIPLAWGIWITLQKAVVLFQ
ncbi:MAG: MFS transporter, partial [Burkholderiaceae bacterium]